MSDDALFDRIRAAAPIDPNPQPRPDGATSPIPSGVPHDRHTQPWFSARSG